MLVELKTHRMSIEVSLYPYPAYDPLCHANKKVGVSPTMPDTKGGPLILELRSCTPDLIKC